MTDNKLPTTDKSDQRDELRAKIEAAERRVASRTLADDARDAAKAATGYAKDNPLTVVGGAVVAGLLIGLMTKPGRRVARNAASGTVSAVSGAATGTMRTVKSATKDGRSAVGSRISDGLVAYGIRIIDEVMDGARAGQDKLEDIGDAARAGARKVTRDAQYTAGSAAAKTSAVTKRTGRRAGRAMRDLANRVGR